MNLSNLDKLKRSFYKRDLLTVAKELLGKIFVKSDPGNLLAGKIVEVEAYDGRIDEAAHTFIGKTKRNEIMFREGGYLYVYFTYGAHFCSNIVTGEEGQGTAVLIRALEPVTGIEQMSLNRYSRNLINEKEKYNLTSGPGKVCQAFGISNEYYGEDLISGRIYLLNQKKIPEDKIMCTTRIGIKKSVELNWRFYIKDNSYVSRK
ncbi:MAG TPA: DNA-3-methyladenine glycosylase [Ignavibacteriaceae bacterium]|nr:DNA-3-methyladenine glycosylase [Ignavibacteriaceae bacterium]